MEEKLRVNVTDAKEIKEISSKDIEEATKMFIYLFACTSEDLQDWKNFLNFMLKNSKPKEILLTLNRVLKKNLKSKIRRPIFSLFQKFLMIIDRNFSNKGAKESYLHFNV